MTTRFDIYDGTEHVTHTHNANTAEYYSEAGYRVTAVSGAVACQIGE